MAERRGDCPFYALKSPEQSHPTVKVVSGRRRVRGKASHLQDGGRGEEEEEAEGGRGKVEEEAFPLSPPPLQLLWEEGRRAPVPLFKGSISAHNDSLFCCNLGGDTVYQYSLPNNIWISLPQCPSSSFSLAVVRGTLITIGGERRGTRGRRFPINILYGLRGDGRGRSSWEACFPPMPTKRSYSTAVSYQDMLVVVGGHNNYTHACRSLATVEVMNAGTLIWFTAPSLPHPSRSPASALLDSQLYLLGGWDDNGSDVLRADLDFLRKSCSAVTTPVGGVQSVWEPVECAPTSASSCAVLRGQLVTVGGKEGRGEVTSCVYVYSGEEGKGRGWREMGRLPGEGVYHCMAASVSDDCLVVVGGVRREGVATSQVWVGQVNETTLRTSETTPTITQTTSTATQISEATPTQISETTPTATQTSETTPTTTQTSETTPTTTQTSETTPTTTQTGETTPTPIQTSETYYHSEQ